MDLKIVRPNLRPQDYFILSSQNPQKHSMPGRALRIVVEFLAETSVSRWRFPRVWGRSISANLAQRRDKETPPSFSRPHTMFGPQSRGGYEQDNAPRDAKIPTIPVNPRRTKILYFEEGGMRFLPMAISHRNAV
jgi:hypothetical protein